MASPTAAHSGGSQTDSDREDVLDLLPPDLEADVVRFRLASSGPSGAAADGAADSAICIPGFQSCPVTILN